MNRFLKSFILVVFLSFTTLPAYADALDTAKAQGLVGEKTDGYLGIVGAPTPDLQALINDINTRRLAVFKGIAAKNGQSLAAVQAVSAEEFMRRTPSGQYVQSAAGTWVKK